MELSRLSDEELCRLIAECEAGMLYANRHAAVVDWMVQAAGLLAECRRRLQQKPN